MASSSHNLCQQVYTVQDHRKQPDSLLGVTAEI